MATLLSQGDYTWCGVCDQVVCSVLVDPLKEEADLMHVGNGISLTSAVFPSFGLPLIYHSSNN